MSNKLIKTVYTFGSRFVAAYRRKSLANEEELTARGALTDEQKQVLLSTAPIQEFIRFQTTNIPRGGTHEFDLSRWGDDLNIISVMVEDPEGDRFQIRILDSNRQLMTVQEFSKNDTPLELPPNPIVPGTIIQIKAFTPIKFFQLIAVPCKILSTIYSEEIYQELAQNGN